MSVWGPTVAELGRALAGAVAEWIGRCIPRYEPEVWNDSPVQHKNNCYNYGCDIQNDTFAQPGFAHGIVLDYPNMDCEAVTQGAIADGLVPVDCDEGCGCDECRHQVALVLRPGFSKDFHFYRRDRDDRSTKKKRWSHKIGHEPATNLDNSDNLIADPETADRGDYTVFCGCFCVDKSKVVISGSKGAEGMEDAITATVGVFSGRPNPEISLTGEAAERLAQSAKRAIGQQPAPPPPPPRLGSYYGFIVRSSRELARRLGLPEEFEVYQGVLTEKMGREPKHWRDTGEVERLLIEQAFRQGHGEVLQSVGVELSTAGRDEAG